MGITRRQLVNKGLIVFFGALMPVGFAAGQPGTGKIDMESLLEEMISIEGIARFPQVPYESLETSSYNRESTHPSEKGWFADSDGTGYLREEVTDGRHEYVIMEHEGPGCVTRMWTPYFYYDLKNHTGPGIRIYLDGGEKPVIAENFIRLLTGQSFVQAPFAQLTTRAGVCYLPIPFEKSCKITLDEKPFYYCVNYRAYSTGTSAESYSQSQFNHLQPLIKKAGEQLMEATGGNNGDRYEHHLEKSISKGDSMAIGLSHGPQAICGMKIHINTPLHSGQLRNVLLRITFDGETTVWCPLGDFFCSADQVNTFHTRFMRASSGNALESYWIMPFRENARIELVNYADENIGLTLELSGRSWAWDEHSMYFHANWVNYGYLPGDRFYDLNFIQIRGKGVLAGDALTVLSPGTGWWGEGDEKIYINEHEIESGFPGLFGTGTEDYYGWAGGEVPTGKDTFSIPFASNVRNGNPENPRGYNICLRNRVLDIIPFEKALKFDMEASPGVDIRNDYNLLAYSMVTYWYGVPGAESNRKPQARVIREKLMDLRDMDLLEKAIREDSVHINYDEISRKVKDLSMPPD